jgi:hypothetical protein
MLHSAAMTELCRLCGGPATERFRQKVLRKYDARYLECASCHSLQTERPYWLEEAYSALDATPDIGFMRRNLLMSALTAEALRAAGVGPDDLCLDWGAGFGLFCRLLRDSGFNFLAYDKYAECRYAWEKRIQNPAGLAPRVITAFEVFEHLPDPARDLEELFNFRPQLLIFSTEIYNGQPADWWYFDPPTGQHVFFYSRAALEWIAARYGYRLVFLDPAWAFVRPDCPLEAGPWVQAGLDSLIHELKTDPWRWVGRDFEAFLAARRATEPSPEP